eukprot:644789-Alexandrium_andersonii.AAC.1
MSASLVGSEMCIRDSPGEVLRCGPVLGTDQRPVPPTGAPSSVPAAGAKRAIPEPLGSTPGPGPGPPGSATGSGSAARMET